MQTMSIHRAVLMVVALVASSLGFVAVSSAPAQAATYSTKTGISYNGALVKHGEDLSIRARVQRTDNNAYVTNGYVVLQRQIIGQEGAGWKTISARTSLAAYPHQPVWVMKPSFSARYRIVFQGASYGGNVYRTSISPEIRVNVRRNLNDNFNRSTKVFYGKVTPNYAGRTLYIHRSTCADPNSSTCSWVLHKTLRTNSTGNWSLRLPTYSRRTHFRGLVTASNNYVGAYSNYYVTTYRY